MNPSRELDLLVAEKVMGFTGDYHPDVVSVYPPQYSTDIQAAMSIVNLLCDNRHRSRISIQGDTSYWWVKFWMIGEAHGEGETLPLAICRAALAGVEV
jgi:hypothetical protein